MNEYCTKPDPCSRLLDHHLCCVGQHPFVQEQEHTPIKYALAAPGEFLHVQDMESRRDGAVRRDQASPKLGNEEER